MKVPVLQIAPGHTEASSEPTDLNSFKKGQKALHAIQRGGLEHPRSETLGQIQDHDVPEPFKRNS